MEELRAKVLALHTSGLDPQMVVNLIIDVVARGLGKLGGRPPRNGSDLPSTSIPGPGEDATSGQSNLKFEVSKPVSKAGETSNLSMSESGSGSVSLVSPDRISQQSSLVVRRSNEPLPSGFAEFWALYPRRVSKIDAIKAWKRQRPNPEEVRTALIWQIEAWDAESPPRPREKLPHPATWLNGRRWEDEKPVALVRSGGQAVSGYGKQDTALVAVTQEALRRYGVGQED